jgi:hypothetical protein
MLGGTMEATPTDCNAFSEAVVFLSHFKDLKRRRQHGKIAYPLDEILLLCLLAVPGRGPRPSSISPCSAARSASLRCFRPFEKGTPAHDHLGDILAMLDAEQFQRCFVTWIAALTGAPGG